MLRRHFRLRAFAAYRAGLLGGFAGGSSGPLRQLGYSARPCDGFLLRLADSLERIAQTCLPIHRARDLGATDPIMASVWGPKQVTRSARPPLASSLRRNACGA